MHESFPNTLLFQWLASELCEYKAFTKAYKEQVGGMGAPHLFCRCHITIHRDPRKSLLAFVSTLNGSGAHASFLVRRTRHWHSRQLKRASVDMYAWPSRAVFCMITHRITSAFRSSLVRHMMAESRIEGSQYNWR